MPGKKIAILCLLCSSIGMQPQQTGTKAARQGPASPVLRAVVNAPQEDRDALRDDLKKMRVLVQQMEANLAFVDTTQSPLKHQFQLEIDMWKTVIDHMERRLNATKAR